MSRPWARLFSSGKVGHQGEFRLRAGFPAEVERGQQVAELLAVEDHALQDAVHEGLQGGGGQAVLGGDGGEFLRRPSRP